MARDWLKSFLLGSFRGVPIWVDYEELSGGRRVAVSNIAYGEVPITEDFGAKPTELPQSIYLAGDDAHFQARALTAALAAPGAAMLILPMGGGSLAHCTQFSRSRSLDRNGFIGFDVSFVAAGSSGVGFGPDTGFAAVLSAVEGFVILADSAYQLVAALANGDDLAIAQKKTATDLLRLLENNGVDDDALTDLQDFAALDNAPQPDFLPIIGNAVIALALEKEDRATFDALAELFDGWKDELTPVSVICQAMAIAGQSMISADMTIDSRAQAKNIRASLSGSLSLIADDIGEKFGYSVAGNMAKIVGLAVSAVSQKIADLAPVVLVETGVSLSATRLAWDIYGDPTRAGELVSRNEVATPAFMPVRFEALSV